MNPFSRRDLAKFAIASVGANAHAAGSAIPARPLGKLNYKTGILGIGAASLGVGGIEQAVVDRVIGEAIDNGVNYIDTAPVYGASEERLGKALEGKRDKVFLASKVELPRKADALRTVEESLRRLRTDRLDCVHIHNVGRDDRWPDLANALSEDGALGALLEARKSGKVLHIGCTAHLRPARVAPAFATGEIEVFMCSLNFVERHIYGFEDKVLPEARRRNIGLVAMKVLGGAVKDSGARLASPENYKAALRYAWGIPGLAVAAVGVSNVEELRQGIKEARAFEALTPAETTELSARGKQLAAQWGPLRGPVV